MENKHTAQKKKQLWPENITNDPRQNKQIPLVILKDLD